MRFADIPQFTRSGSWECDFDLVRLVRYIEELEKEEGLQLNPNFQRGHVWTEEQQIAFLEYFLRGGKSGTTIYLNKPDWQRAGTVNGYNDFVCVDGLQRITAVKRFVNNEIPVFGAYFKEYEDKSRVLPYGFKLNINDLKTESEVLQWYIDMNSGGTPHTAEEIERVKRLMEEAERKHKNGKCKYLSV